MASPEANHSEEVIVPESIQEDEHDSLGGNGRKRGNGFSHREGDTGKNQRPSRRNGWLS